MYKANLEKAIQEEQRFLRDKEQERSNLRWGYKKTTDINLVAYLDLQDIKPTSTLQEGRYMAFYFDPDSKYDEEVEKYNSHKALVDPLAYSERYRMLRKISIDQRRY